MLYLLVKQYAFSLLLSLCRMIHWVIWIWHLTLLKNIWTSPKCWMQRVNDKHRKFHNTSYTIPAKYKAFSSETLKYVFHKHVIVSESLWHKTLRHYCLKCDIYPVYCLYVYVAVDCGKEKLPKMYFVIKPWEEPSSSLMFLTYNKAAKTLYCKN